MFVFLFCCHCKCPSVLLTAFNSFLWVRQILLFKLSHKAVDFFVCFPVYTFYCLLCLSYLRNSFLLAYPGYKSREEHKITLGLLPVQVGLLPGQEPFSKDGGVI